jgi:DNA-binding response OmpR family regulator
MAAVHTGASPALRPLIYVLEDDRDVAQVVISALSENGFAAEHVASGRTLLQKQRCRPARLCIVDLGLPDLDGLNVVRELREALGCAIMILTGRNELSDRVAGLELGADDYVVKPFEPRELVARVRSILRRLQEPDSQGRSRTIARFADWTFEYASQSLTDPHGRSTQLGKAEADPLHILLRRPNRILAREQLLPDSAEPPIDRTIDARISRLRKRLADGANGCRILKTVYGAGYILAVQVEWV